MIVSISAADSRPIYRQIVDEVMRSLVVGSLREGDALPSIRQLARELRLNPNTVQQAYRELERDGVVHVRRGEGTFVSRRVRRLHERNRLLRQVAHRALVDARRHGFDLPELVDALHEEQAGGEAPYRDGS